MVENNRVIKMLLIQFIGVLFGLFAAYFTYMHFKRNEFGKSIYLFWEMVWILLILISIFPNYLEPIVFRMSFARTLDMLTISGILLGIATSFYAFTVSLRNRKKLEEIVRKLAHKNVKKK